MPCLPATHLWRWCDLHIEWVTAAAAGLDDNPYVNVFSLFQDKQPSGFFATSNHRAPRSPVAGSPSSSSTCPVLHGYNNNGISIFTIIVWFRSPASVADKKIPMRLTKGDVCAWLKLSCCSHDALLSRSCRQGFRFYESNGAKLSICATLCGLGCCVVVALRVSPDSYSYRLISTTQILGKCLIWILNMKPAVDKWTLCFLGNRGECHCWK